MLFIILLVSLIYFIIKVTFRDEKFNRIPGPKGVFLFENGLDFLMDHVKLFYYMRHLYNRYKPLGKLRLGTTKIVIFHRPEDVETVLTSTKCHAKGYLYAFVKPWLKSGLLLSDGTKWQQRRKLFTPAFHFNVLAKFKPVIEENCQDLVKSLEAEVNKSKTDIYSFVNNFTINSICETALGTKLDEEVSSFGKKYRNGIHKLGQYAVYRAQRIWMHPNFIFKFTDIGKKQNNILDILTGFRNKVMERRRLLNNNDLNIKFDEIDSDYIEINHKAGSKKLALLDLLFKAEKEGKIDTAGIEEEVDTFMFGGHDTAANTLQFTMLLLANHQNIQEKVIEEFNEIFGSSDRPATMADLAEMKYLTSCIKECLRLYPPVPIITRINKEEIKLANYEVPKGTECAMSIFDLQRRDDQFVEPLEFRPERFLEEPTWHPYSYLPFSAGVRNCMGQKFAMMEMKLAMSAVLRRYRILPVTTPRDIVFVMDYVLRIRDPIYVKFEERR